VTVSSIRNRPRAPIEWTEVTFCSSLEIWRWIMWCKKDPDKRACKMEDNRVCRLIPVAAKETVGLVRMETDSLSVFC